MSKFVYTVSEKGSMPRDILMSLQTLSKFYSKKDIVVVVTPPFTYDFIYKLEKYAEVIHKPNITNKFKFKPNKKPSYYGEKVHLCDLYEDTVVFLDCDTVIKKDIKPLLEGDFDISYRIGSSYNDFDMDKWNCMFKKINKNSIPMPNAGFIIFKNGLHKRIKDDWLKYINSEIGNAHPKLNHKEQMALAMALPKDCKIKYMSEREHAFRWKNEDYTKCYVYHIGL